MQIPKDAEGLIEDFVRQLVNGDIDHASARCELGMRLRKTDHLQFADFDWLDTVLSLNTALRCCWRQHEGGLDDVILDQWPAQELIKVGVDQEHVDWPSRWRARGGEIFNGRMIALKDDSVWQCISDFAYPFPPFAVGSKMRVRDIDRNAAMSLRLIDRDRRVHVDHFPPPTLYLDIELPEKC